MQIKIGIQKVLRKFGLYERIRASWLYDLYWTMTDRKVIDDRQRELEFYRRLLDGFREGDLIFDIGANHGYKTDIFLRLGAKVVAIEPDKSSQQVLEQKFRK